MAKACLVVLAAFLFVITPAAQTASWRPTIVAQHGMVAAGHPLAAEAGMRILKAGGNAIDAAIATWAVQGEVEPGMTGLGADMFVLYYNAKTGQVKFINGTGFAAQAATIDFYKSKGGIPDEGPAVDCGARCASAARRYAVKTYGTKPLADVLAPAIEIADGGFPITEALARRHRRARRRSSRNSRRRRRSSSRTASRWRWATSSESRSRADAARDRRAGAGCVLQGRHREEHRRLPRKRTAASSPKPISPATSRSRTRRST